MKIKKKLTKKEKEARKAFNEARDRKPLIPRSQRHKDKNDYRRRPKHPGKEDSSS